MSKFIHAYFFLSLYFFTPNQTQMRKIKISYILLLFLSMNAGYFFTFFFPILGMDLLVAFFFFLSLS